MKHLLFWSPRALAIAFILFLSLFSLDVFEMWGDVWEIARWLLVHNIPGIVLAAILATAWRRPMIGAIGYALAWALYIATALDPGRDLWTAFAWSITISGPAWLIAGLFLTEWLNTRSNHR